jgi:hypothetical protein
MSDAKDRPVCQLFGKRPSQSGKSLRIIHPGQRREKIILLDRLNPSLGYINPSIAAARV